MKCLEICYEIWNPFKKKINCFSITNFWNSFKTWNFLKSIRKFGTPSRRKSTVYLSLILVLFYDIKCLEICPEIWNHFYIRKVLKSVPKSGTPFTQEMSWNLSRNLEPLFAQKMSWNLVQNLEPLLHKKCLEIWQEIWNHFKIWSCLKTITKLGTPLEQEMEMKISILNCFGIFLNGQKVQKGSWF